MINRLLKRTTLPHLFYNWNALSYEYVNMYIADKMFHPSKVQVIQRLGDQIKKL